MIDDNIPSNSQWDVFISHASEDKESFVRPLAQALRAAGTLVWYDELTLRLGDSLRQSIERGLAKSRFGVVVLSPSFFSKQWPQTELDGLAAREKGGQKIILPVWHDIDHDGVAAVAPMLAGRIAVRSSEPLDEVVRQILEVVHAAEARPTTAPGVAPTLYADQGNSELRVGVNENTWYGSVGRYMMMPVVLLVMKFDGWLSLAKSSLDMPLTVTVRTGITAVLGAGMGAVMTHAIMNAITSFSVSNPLNAVMWPSLVVLAFGLMLGLSLDYIVGHPGRYYHVTAIMAAFAVCVVLCALAGTFLLIRGTSVNITGSLAVVVMTVVGALTGAYVDMLAACLQESEHSD